MRFGLLTVSLPSATLMYGQNPTPRPGYVVTHIDLMPAGTATGVTLLKDFAAQTLKEKDCLQFEVLQQDGRPNHTMVGIWKGKSLRRTRFGSVYEKSGRAAGSRFRSKRHRKLCLTLSASY